ncbi:MAG: CsgG/HfaB family protein [Treponema sp.]|nr:CsgG/HfaB family protein [Treponema sp.]
MKKVFSMAGCLAFMLAFGIQAAHAQPVSLDTAIQRAGEGLSVGVGTNARIAVLAMQSNTSRMSDYLINEMIAIFVGMQARQGFTVVDRAQLDLLVGEMQLGITGLIDDTTAQNIGRIMGVQYIVSGTFESLAGFFRFRTQVLEVETAAIRAMHTVDVQNDSLVTYLLDATRAPPVATATPTQPMPAFFPGTAFNHFSTGERWATWALNQILPGVGSFAIMGDRTGGMVQLLIGGPGMILYIVGAVGSPVYNAMGVYMGRRINEGPFIVGFLMVLTSQVYNIVRSATFMRNAPEPRVRTASIINPEAWNIAINPGENGIEGVSFTHTLRF